MSIYMGHHNRGCWKRLKRALLHLANKGWSIRLLLSETTIELEHPNIVVQTIKLNVDESIVKLLTFSLIAMFKSMRFAIKHPKSIFLAFDGHNAFPIYWPLFLAKNNPILLFVRGFPYFQLTRKNKLSIFTKTHQLLDRIGHFRATRVTYNSLATAKRIERIYRKKNQEFDVLYNDINLVTQPLKSSRLAARENFGISSTDFVIGYCGQFITRKNIGFLITAFTRFKHNNSAILLLKGTGPLLLELKHLANALGVDEKVIFLPWDEDLENFYLAIDVFILPSLYDDSSNSLLEAIAFGTKVIASDTGGNREILSNNKAQLFSIKDNGFELVNILNNILLNDDYGMQIQNVVESLALNLNFDWDSEFENILMRYCNN